MVAVAAHARCEYFQRGSRASQCVCCWRWPVSLHVCPSCPGRAHASLQSRDEVRVLSSMAHPNIVLYHDCFNDGSKQYIAMEFCEARRMAPGTA